MPITPRPFFQAFLISYFTQRRPAVFAPTSTIRHSLPFMLLSIHFSTAASPSFLISSHLFAESSGCSSIKPMFFTCCTLWTVIAVDMCLRKCRRNSVTGVYLGQETVLSQLLLQATGADSSFVGKSAMALYEVLIIGSPKVGQADALTKQVEDVAGIFSLAMPDDLAIRTTSDLSARNPKAATVALYFGGDPTVDLAVVGQLKKAKVPIVPVVGNGASVTASVPAEIAHTNACLID